MRIGELGRYWRTVRHLRPQQIATRLYYAARRPLWERRSAAVNARYRARAAGLEACRWDHPGLARVAGFRAGLRDEAAALASAEDALAGRFRFLGRTESFGDEVEWFRPDLDRGTRLWKTHLHEFSYALDLARTERATQDPRYRERLFALARSWRTAAPIGCPGFARDAWNARAVATRIVTWATAGATLQLGSGSPDADADWLGAEIGLHGLFLRDNLELDLRGNHLFRDAAGLVFANELVGGVPDALAWLERQVAEQVLPDGCHIERAPFYQAICLQDLFEVALLLGEERPEWLEDALARMAGWLDAVLLGDGEIPLLGDGWLGEVRPQPLLAAVADTLRPTPPDRPERHGGLVPLTAGTLRLVVRAGPHGPDELLGHAHADLLSFDLSVGAHRIVTDTGTLLYDPGPERDRIRSTAAHNTLRIDGVEQLEAWGSFRVGRRGRAYVAARGEALGWSWLSCWHDAYRSLPGRPIHHRMLAVGERGALVLDAVHGTGRHQIESRLNEHPSSQEQGARIVALAGSSETGEVGLHEHFGQTRPMRQWRVDADAPLPWSGGWWIDARPAAAGAPAELGFGAAGEILASVADADLRVSWRPGAREPDAVRLSLCSPERGSAN